MGIVNERLEKTGRGKKGKWAPNLKKKAIVATITQSAGWGSEFSWNYGYIPVQGGGGTREVT